MSGDFPTDVRVFAVPQYQGIKWNPRWPTQIVAKEDGMV
jgi:hypothetical protein